MRVRIEDMDDHDRRDVLRWLDDQGGYGMRAVNEFLDACKAALEEEPVPVDQPDLWGIADI